MPSAQQKARGLQPEANVFCGPGKRNQRFYQEGLEVPLPNILSNRRRVQHSNTHAPPDESLRRSCVSTELISVRRTEPS